MAPALFFLAAHVIAVLMPLVSVGHARQTPQLSNAEANVLLDALCDLGFRALPQAQQVGTLSGLSQAFHALDSAEQAKVLTYPGFQPANCSSLARPSRDPAGGTAAGGVFYLGLRPPALAKPLQFSRRRPRSRCPSIDAAQGYARPEPRPGNWTCPLRSVRTEPPAAAAPVLQSGSAT